MTQRFRHKKTGGVYEVVAEALMQTTDPRWDYVQVKIYRGKDGQHWARPVTEFNERFEALEEGK